MPLHPIGIAFYLTLLVFFVVLIGIGFARSARALRIIGYGGGTLVLLGGAVFSTMLYMMSVGMSADPADLSPFIPLLICVLASAPFYAVAWARIRQLTHKPGHCRQCGYDLRGNRGANTCPECGAGVSPRQ